MASKNPARTMRSHQQEFIETHSSSTNASQEADQQFWISLAQQRQRRTRERRAKITEEVLRLHNERTRKVSKKIKATFKRYDNQKRAMRRPGLQHLLELIQKKHDIEIQFDKSKAEFETAFHSTIKQLQFALERRVEDLD